MLGPYRVLDLTTDGAMFCGQILADLGADVIAVEPPGGSPSRRIGPFAGDAPDPDRSLYFWSYNRNKRSVTLDIEAQEGRDRFRELVQGADFVIESFTPGYLDEIGLGWPVLRALNSRLVMVSITPFGQTGPKAQWAATDLIALAASGVLLMTGDDDRPPVQVSLPQAYLHAGAEAAVGALLAHTARQRDNIGQHVDISAQVAAMMATQSYILAEGWGDRAPSRIAGGLKVGRFKLHCVYACVDGHVSVTFLFGATIGPYTARLFQWMHEEGFVDEATRDLDWVGFFDRPVSKEKMHEDLLRATAAIERFMLSKTKAELFAEAQRRRLLIVPVSTTADLVASEQYRARDYWTEVRHEELETTITYPGPFAKFSATPIRYGRRPPLVGEHTEQVLNGKAPARNGRARRRRSAAEAAALAEQWEASASMMDADEAFGSPLAGLKVLDLMWVFAGPMGTRYLADRGATVIRVESGLRPDTLRAGGPYKDRVVGLERSAGIANPNACKLGLSLNLGSPEARRVVMRLVEWADVVTESFSPRAMRGWGLGYEELRAVKPDLIMLSTCLMGQTGPLAMLAGFGTMGAALSGFHELTGWPDRLPAGPFSAYTDYTTPKFVAASILAALDHKRRTGEGQYIDLSQAEAGMHFLAPALLDYTVNGRVQTRQGNADPDRAPHGVFPCRGKDRWVAIACETEEQWQALCEATDHPQWVTDPRFATIADRLHNRVALEATLAAWTAEREVRQVVIRLQAAGVPAHRVIGSGDAFRDPQLKFRRHFITVQHPELGPVPIEGSRMRFSHARAQIARPGPTIGQDNDHVLRAILGMDDEEITELIVSGALT